MTESRTDEAPWPSIWDRIRLYPSEAEQIAALLTFVLIVVVAFWEDLRDRGGVPLLIVAGISAAFVCAAWVLRFFVVLVRWRRSRRALTEHKRAWLVLPVLTALAGVVAWTALRPPTTFEVKVWRNSPPFTKNFDRWHMADDLRANHLPSGLPRGKVVTMLGPPQSGGWESERLLWWLKSAPPPDIAFWLEVRFDPEGLLTETRVLVQ